MTAGPREAFLHQAAQCDGRSPFYAALCRRLADDPVAISLVAAEPAWNSVLRLLGGMHYLVLEERARWDEFPEALDRHEAFLKRFVAEQGVQTNEVQRSWMLLPCFLEIVRRTGAETLDLIELGPSAGLNLVWDRYRYRYAEGSWGPNGALLELAGEERRRVPAELLGLTPRVRRRVGIDVAPVDLTTEEGAGLLKAFVWPDETWRLELLDRAIAALRTDPPELIRGDVVAELPRLLADREDGAFTIVYQTAVLGYVGTEGARQVHASLEQAARTRPLAYVGTHQPAPDVHGYYGLAVRLLPRGEREIVAHADFHGAWLDWLL